jgi:methyltransferase (TIGR00027 family)
MGSVADTALGVAAVRAAESGRPDHLFADPLAATFLAARPEWRPQSKAADPRMQAILRHIVIRTRFFDEMLLDAVKTCRQVVVLGAGLDVRSFRLTWPVQTTLFELDQPEMLSWKQEQLDNVGADPACRRVTVPVDLRADWLGALDRAGHNGNEPTAWLAEGLLVYLATDAVERLITDVGDQSAPGSRLGMTIRRATAVSPPEPFDEMWISAAPDDPEVWLRGHGWLASFYGEGELATRYGRPEWSGTSGSELVDARRLPH